MTDGTEIDTINLRSNFEFRSRQVNPVVVDANQKAYGTETMESPDLPVLPRPDVVGFGRLVWARTKTIVNIESYVDAVRGTHKRT